MSDRHLRFWPKSLPREVACPQTSLYFNLEAAAVRFPQKTFIDFYGTKLTYADARRQVDALAGYLQSECEIRKGDRVLLYLQNSPQFMVSYYAILRADAVVVPVSPMNLTGELRHIAEDSGARVAIVGQELLAQVSPLLGGAIWRVIVAAYGDYIRDATDLPLPESLKAPRMTLSGPHAMTWNDALGARRAPGPHTSGPDDLCAMPYTSGTTGRPKGCMHSHRTVMTTAVWGPLWCGLAPDTVTLCSLPLFHVVAMQACMNGPVYFGQTVILMQRWDRDVAARLIEKHRVSSWNCIATMAVDFLANPDVRKYDLSSLIRIGGGGASMPESVARKFRELTGLDYVEGYGLTETMAPTHINLPHRPKPQCLGVPMQQTDARVVDPGTLREMPQDEVGEIVVHGPQVFLGYWNNAKATEDAFAQIDGKQFLRTGDMGRCDEEGYFFITDRLKRMINASGMKVWPAEVEAMMYGHPDIQEACVIAAPDAYRGETVKALVVLRKDAADPSEEKIISWCRSNMSAYKVPRIVQFVEKLPKSATGKIQWRLLQEEEWKRAGT